MQEKFDLKEMLKEIEEDEEGFQNKAKLASQDDIKKIFLAKKKKKEASHD